ncbi:MAG TPA: ATP phosphoribosyltransferase regulatory subunit, partial [Verrucomicrobiae bacterium]|nr:ATP phosphoribosyltransferase regulatory subunit [Verrucomicrobiae bacterium]
MERLPGFRDFYPEPLPHQDEWSADTRNYIFGQWREVARRYGFREYDGPPLEPLELFTTKSGDEIVGQLYNFTDKGERAIALRPEMTPTLARMVAAAERAYKKPIKWFAIPQLFRYERQQKGRLREHFQLNCDIFGESDPAADAELIALLIDVLRSFGLTAADFVIRLSSRNAWQDFFKQR